MKEVSLWSMTLKDQQMIHFLHEYMHQQHHHQSYIIKRIYFQKEIEHLGNPKSLEK